MSVITKVLKQKCVYWEPESISDFGQPTYSNPVEMNCRWMKGSAEVIKPDGTLTTSSATAMVSEDLKIGGILMLGTLEDVLYLQSPTKNEEAFEIIQFFKVPNFKATEYMRVAYL